MPAIWKIMPWPLWEMSWQWNALERSRVAEKSSADRRSTSVTCRTCRACPVQDKRLLTWLIMSLLWGALRLKRVLEPTKDTSRYMGECLESFWCQAAFPRVSFLGRLLHPLTSYKMRQRWIKLKGGTMGTGWAGDIMIGLLHFKLMIYIFLFWVFCLRCVCCKDWINMIPVFFAFTKWQKIS